MCRRDLSVHRLLAELRVESPVGASDCDLRVTQVPDSETLSTYMGVASAA